MKYKSAKKDDKDMDDMPKGKKGNKMKAKVEVKIKVKPMKKGMK